MNSDNYEFAKSSVPQSVDNYSAYTDKQWNYINDINNAVYSNNSGLTQVQFDLTSIYNSGGFTDSRDMFLTIPIVMTAAYATSSGAVVTLPAASLGLGTAASVGGCAGYSLCSLKTNYQNLIHQIEIQADGKVINETQPFVNVFQNFRMLSQMSTTDLNTFGTSLNFNQAIDNEKSMSFNMAPSGITGGAVSYSNRQGIGLTNNIPYLAGQAGTTSQSSGQPAMNGGAVNTAIANRISRFADLGNTPATSAQSLFGTASSTLPTQLTIMTATQLQTEFKPYFTYIGNVLCWYDVAIIPVKYLCDVMDKLGLVRKLSSVMRIYLNTGSIAVPVTNPALNTQYFGAPTNSTFPNTCPITLNNVQGISGSPTNSIANPASVPLTTAFVCAGVFVARAPTTAIGVGTSGSVNIGLGVANHPMPACRAYYSLVKMEPSRALKYVEENRNKLVVYEQLITNQYNNIGAGSSYSQLVQSGIKNPLGLLIVPLISQSQTTTLSSASPYAFSQYGSPLDTCPATYAPISLTNLQVTLGGQNILNSTLFYTYESFLEQVVLADNLTSSDLGIGAGLINQAWFENNRTYYVDLKRSRDADKASTRNLNISFTNNSNVAIDIIVFTIYLDKLVIDVETGLIRK
jgi:hypothetical protein